ncbi:hypothetical protein OEA41_005393 [Lepraria neglecta]|uniref:Uncharacterized protein n=1 Tax=Lepraria neglecta TaxID=209136 RepID=A0AAD9Z0F4_9LECA|nr:hypothetical protein OEA41_005393 [Lepraria neglecta]
MELSPRHSKFIEFDQVEVSSASDGEANEARNALQEQKTGTRQDVHDMSRMGKRQELRRKFHFISIVGFVMIFQSTWENILLAAQYGLTNGGTAGVIWVTVGFFVFLIVFWVTSEHAPAKEVFTQF